MQFGYINLINNPCTDTWFDSIIQVFNSDLKPIKQKNTVILELGSLLENKELIELNNYPIDKKYESIKLSKKFNSCTPLYIVNNFNKTYFQINKEDNIEILVYPIGTNIDCKKCKYSCAYKSTDDLEVIFGIWRLQESNSNLTKFLVSWNTEKISKDFLLYLLKWIFVENSI